MYKNSALSHCCKSLSDNYRLCWIRLYNERHFMNLHIE